MFSFFIDIKPWRNNCFRYHKKSVYPGQLLLGTFQIDWLLSVLLTSLNKGHLKSARYKVLIHQLNGTSWIHKIDSNARTCLNSLHHLCLAMNTINNQDYCWFNPVLKLCHQKIDAWSKPISVSITFVVKIVATRKYRAL